MYKSACHLRGRFNTSCHYRWASTSHAHIARMEIADAKVPESHAVCYFWPWWIVSSRSPSDFSRERTAVADFLVFSVTIVSVVRLVYLTTLSEVDLTVDIANTIIWTCVEVNISMICGQYNLLSPVSQSVTKLTISISMSSLTTTNLVISSRQMGQIPQPRKPAHARKRSPR